MVGPHNCLKKLVMISNSCTKEWEAVNPSNNGRESVGRLAILRKLYVNITTVGMRTLICRTLPSQKVPYRKQLKRTLLNQESGQ